MQGTASALSAGLLGIDGYVVKVTATVELGAPSLTISGRSSPSLDEARERVRHALGRHALGRCGHPLPPRRQTISIEPEEADSPGLDLAVACALLAAHGVVPESSLEGLLLWGELTLDGTVRPAPATLVAADLAQRRDIGRIAVAASDAGVQAVAKFIKVLPVSTLEELVSILRNGEVPAWGRRLAPEDRQAAFAELRGKAPPADQQLDMADIRGLSLGRRALEVALAGGHSLLLHGPHGVGRTMLARRAGGLLPDLTPRGAMEVSKIHGLVRRQSSAQLIRRPPVRMPHHTVSSAGLFGGGHPPRPGEVTLAHRGVLFLDDLPEMPLSYIEGLRAVLRDGLVDLPWRRRTVHLPASFILIATMSDCPCGYRGHPERACVCSDEAVARYRSRVPLDLFDMIVNVAPITSEEIEAGTGEASEPIRRRIEAARSLNKDRPAPSAEAADSDVRRELAGLTSSSSARVLRVAQTIAGLEGHSGRPSAAHVHEARSLRIEPGAGE
mgnify:FL=1